MGHCYGCAWIYSGSSCCVCIPCQICSLGWRNSHASSFRHLLPRLHSPLFSMCLHTLFDLLTTSLGSFWDEVYLSLSSPNCDFLSLTLSDGRFWSGVDVVMVSDYLVWQNLHRLSLFPWFVPKAMWYLYISFTSLSHLLTSDGTECSSECLPPFADSQVWGKTCYSLVKKWTPKNFIFIYLWRF